MPHARVTSIDASAALAMPGVHGVLTADEVDESARAAGDDSDERAVVRRPSDPRRRGRYRGARERRAREDQGHVRGAAVHRRSAAELVSRAARTRARTATSRIKASICRTSSGRRRISRRSRKGSCRRARPSREWSFGDIDAGFASAKLVLDETFVTAGLGASLDGAAQRARVLAERQVLSVRLDAEPELPDPGHRALRRRRARGSRLRLGVLRRRLRLEGRRLSADGDSRADVEEDRPARDDARRRGTRSTSWARRAPGFQGRIKMGFAADGRVTAVDLYIVQENGPNTGFNDWLSAAEAVSIVYQPPAMRFRGVPVLTNTPPRGPQRGPGQNQIAAAVEPLIDKAAQAARARSRRDSAHQRARQRGEDRLDAGRRDERLSEGCARSRRRAVRLGRAASAQRPAQRLEGARRRRRHGVPLGRRQRLRRPRAHHAGRQDPHSHGRRQSRHVFAHGDVARRGRGAEGELGQLHRRARRQQQALAVESRAVRQQHVVHDDAHELRRRDGRRREAQGDRGDGSWAARRTTTTSAASACSRRATRRKGLTYAQAAQRAIELGGKFDGHEVPERLERHDEGVGGRRRRHGPRRRREGQPAARRAPCRRSRPASSRSSSTSRPASSRSSTTSASPTAARSCTRRAWRTQIKSGAVMGIGLAASERHIYDPQNGLPGNIGLLQAKPPSYLDVPATMTDGLGRHRRPAEPGRREGYRRARPGLRGGRAAVRDLRRARRPLLQPHAGDART